MKPGTRPAMTALRAGLHLTAAITLGLAIVAAFALAPALVLLWTTGGVE